MAPEPMLVELADDNQPDADMNGCSIDNDVEMKSEREVTMEPPDYSVSTPFQPQPEHPMFYSQVGQVADNINQYQTYTTHNNHVNWALMVSMPSSVCFVSSKPY